MRILHAGKFYPPHRGGMESALKDICETTRGAVELEVAVANDGRGTVNEILEHVRVSRLSNWGSLFSQPVTPGLWRIFRSTQARIVHLHEPNPLAMVAFLTSGCGAKLVVHYHSDIVRQKRLMRLYRPWLQAGLRRASMILAGSRELVESSTELAPWRSKCQVVPFGIDLDPFLAIRRDYLPDLDKPPLVLAVGRLSYYKGFHYLIDAMEQVNGRLVIVGDGEMRAELEDRVNTLGLDGRVGFAGSVSQEQLIKWYERASLFCLPSCERSEAFGLVMAEAMAAGLPVVSTDLPTGVRAVNAHGESGLVVPPGDPTSLASALNLLAGDPALRRKMGQAARHRAVDRFGRELMGRRIVSLYRRVAGPEPRLVPAALPLATH